MVEEFLFDLSDPEGSRSPLPAEDLEEIEGMEDEEDGFKEEEEEIVKEEEEEVKEEMKGDGEDRKWGDPRQGWSLSEAGTLTIGDLYCLLGGREGSSLRLDYCWRGSESHSPRPACRSCASSEPRSHKQSELTQCES